LDGGLRLNRLGVAALVVLIAATFSIGLVLLRPPNTVMIVIRGVVLHVELAKTPSDQERGLSGRDSMSLNRGMLFVFQRESPWGFWMKDMRFSLDIIWFDSNRKIIFIEENLPPCSPQYCPVYTPTASAMFVLEVNAGFVQTHGVSLEDTFNFIV